MEKNTFDSKFLEKIKKALLEEKQRLEKELAQFAQKKPWANDDFDTRHENYGDEDEENAKEVAAYGDNLALEQTLESALRDVNDALKRLEDGTYGICKYCGKPIDEKRLEARPASSACVKCKENLTRR
jgi:RNA polymerase-binding transcription factor DksA